MPAGHAITAYSVSKAPQWGRFEDIWTFSVYYVRIEARNLTTY